MAEPLELKKTLNLPKTEFSMKAGLPQNEPKQLEAWYGSNIYERILAGNPNSVGSESGILSVQSSGNAPRTLQLTGRLSW